MHIRFSTFLRHICLSVKHNTIHYEATSHRLKISNEQNVLIVPIIFDNNGVK